MTTDELKTGRTGYGLAVGTPRLKSIGPITFSPDGILFVADSANATIYAIDVGDTESPSQSRPVEVDNLDVRLAAYTACTRDDILIRDMAVHPTSMAVYLSLVRGRGSSAIPLLVRIGDDGSLREVSLEGVPFSKVVIKNAPADDDERLDTRVVLGDREGEEVEVRGIRLQLARDKLRTSTVTDMAFVDGLLLVAGASNEEFSSTLRRMPFPFKDEAETNSLEIFHVSHGRYETASPIGTFVPYGDNLSVLASYTCTPVVHFSLGDLKSGTQAKGRTVADLGAMNTPIDIVAYERGGEEYVLVSNTRHPLLKIACADIDGQEPLTQPQQPVGVPREALPQEGVSRMASANGTHVLMLQQDAAGGLHLRSYDSASL
jgi:hypothetical protein